MAKKWLVRRGTATEHNSFTGDMGEVTMDVTNKTLRVHDGITVGGNPVITVETLKLIYPVGAIYIGTTTTCPLASFFGTWTLVSSGKALWTGNGSNANTTINAGLPNITGSTNSSANSFAGTSTTGVFSGTAHSSSNWCTGTVQTWQGNFATGLNFDASRSNSIYGKSSTVQPPAYVVNVWRRTA